MRRLMTTALGLAVLAACTDQGASVLSPTTPPLFEISDGAHSGNTRFYFLPPMVPEPSPSGTFDGSLAPVVQVCEWTGAECAAPLVAEYTMTTGPGSETVRVVPEEEHYLVNWHTDQFALDATTMYRIRVLVGSVQVGHADVDVVASGNGLQNVDTGAFIALKDGRTLPIKFRIEQGVNGCPPNCNSGL